MQEHTRKEGSNTVFAHKVVETYHLFSPLSKEKEKRKNGERLSTFPLESVSEMTRVDWWVHLAMLKIEQRTFEHLHVDVPGGGNIPCTPLPKMKRAARGAKEKVNWKHVCAEGPRSCTQRENLTEVGMACQKTKVTLFMEAVHTAREHGQSLTTGNRTIFAAITVTNFRSAQCLCMVCLLWSRQRV